MAEINESKKIEFNKPLFFSNTIYLLRLQDKKIGELEAFAGVSPGYISRASKEDVNSKPGIDFIMSVAAFFNVSLDTLLGIDLSGMTNSERYAYDFIMKLISDTADCKLNWTRQPPVNYLELSRYGGGTTNHPLYNWNNDSGVYYHSGFFSLDPAARYDNKVTLYSVNLDGKDLYLSYIKSPSLSKPCCELQFVEEFYNDINVYPFCGTSLDKPDSSVNKALDRLYQAVSDTCNNLNLTSPIRNIIDSYMGIKNDDDDGDLPF